MKIGVLIDQPSSLYCWQWMGHHDHEYIIYRDQLYQDSSQTTLAHHHNIMKTGLDYLVGQGVEYIICPPILELHFQGLYPQILPVFQQYLSHTLQHSIVGKMGFVGTPVQCESINLHWGDITSNYSPGDQRESSGGEGGNVATEGVLLNKQLNNRHFNPNFPIRTSTDIHLSHRLTDHKPDHYICNTLIKSLLRPLKNASVDTVIGLDWAYYVCDVSRAHHCRSIKRHRSDIIGTIYSSLLTSETKWLGEGSGVRVAIHHTGTLRDLEQNKKLRWMLSRGQNTEIQQIKIG